MFFLQYNIFGQQLNNKESYSGLIKNKKKKLMHIFSALYVINFSINRILEIYQNVYVPVPIQYVKTINCEQTVLTYLYLQYR
jgi:hypothetical protein